MRTIVYFQRSAFASDFVPPPDCIALSDANWDYYQKHHTTPSLGGSGGVADVEAAYGEPQKTYEIEIGWQRDESPSSIGNIVAWTESDGWWTFESADGCYFVVNSHSFRSIDITLES